MRKLLIAALAASTLTPVVASAQSAGEVRRGQEEVRRGQNEVRQGRDEVRRDLRRGDMQEAREDRRELREDRREVRKDRREVRQDWRQYRQNNRQAFRQGRYNGPRGYRYAPVTIGYRFAPTYYSQRYWIGDPYRYRLPRPSYNQRWIRYGNDVILINVRTGRVVQVYRSFFW